MACQLRPRLARRGGRCGARRRRRRHGARTAKRTRRHQKARHGEVRRLAEIEDLGEVPRGGIAHGQRAQVPARFDESQDRGVIVEAMRDGGAPRPRRDDERRHAEAAQAVVVARRAVGWRNGKAARRHVLEEAAPLVEIDDEQRVRPVGARRHRLVDRVQEDLAVADVRVRDGRRSRGRFPPAQSSGRRRKPPGACPPRSRPETAEPAG